MGIFIGVKVGRVNARGENFRKQIMLHLEWLKIWEWLIWYSWQEFTWAVLVLSFATHFPRIYSAAVSLDTIRQRRPSGISSHQMIGSSPMTVHGLGSVICTGQHGDQAGLTFGKKT